MSKGSITGEIKEQRGLGEASEEDIIEVADVGCVCVRTSRDGLDQTP